MKQAGCRHLPVVEGDHLVGMVSQRDLLQIDLTREGRGDPLAERLHPLHPPRRRRGPRSLPRVRVVLVRPEAPVNVGAAARVVRNTGLERPRPRGRRATGARVECWRTAWGAHEVLEQARVFADLASAVADAGLRRRRSPAGARAACPALDVRDAGRRGGGPRRRTRRAALVFGPETSGLTHDELAPVRAPRRSSPSHPDQPSLNLSHAVMVAALRGLRARAPRPRAAAAGHHGREGSPAGAAARRAWAPSRPCPPTTRTRYFGSGGPSSSART